MTSHLKISWMNARDGDPREGNPAGSYATVDIFAQE